VSGRKSDLIERLIGLDLDGRGDSAATELESRHSKREWGADTWADGIEGIELSGAGDKNAPPSISLDLDFDLDDERPSDASAERVGRTLDDGRGEHRRPPETPGDLPCPELASALVKRGVSSLLPVQSKSFELIFGGRDAVLHAPTGSGKTLAFAVPLLGRLEVEPRRRSATPFSNRGGVPSAATPRIVVLAPSRELAKQIGREIASLHPRKTKGVAVVFGGAPLERNVAALRTGQSRGGRSGVDIVVGTAGRLRELVREKHLTFDAAEMLVVDEADSLLDFKDNPDVERLLDLMEDREFQLVLSSATVNKHVKEYAMEIMDIDEASESFVDVVGHWDGKEALLGEDGAECSPLAGGKDGLRVPVVSTDSSMSNERRGAIGAPPVRHWSIAAKSSGPIRSSVLSDLLATLRPRISIIFVPTKAEVESLGASLSNFHGGGLDVKVLHGDMVQSARTRTLALLRDGEDGGSAAARKGRQRVLVATDVASRGLDLEGVDLVVQFGVPRDSGKEGTFDAELYAHRTGRAGRFGGGGNGARREGSKQRIDMGAPSAADAVTLYDPTRGEAKVLHSLREELRKRWGFDVWERYPPSPADVMEAAYHSASEKCKDADVGVVQFFRERLLTEGEGTDDPLLDKLAFAMAALSGLNEVSPKRSLLTADPAQRTIRARKTGTAGADRSSIIPVTPQEITKLCKGLGTGKIGRVTILDDGSAVFDLPAKKAEWLVKTLQDSTDEIAEDEEWHADLPISLFF